MNINEYKGKTTIIYEKKEKDKEIVGQLLNLETQGNTWKQKMLRNPNCTMFNLKNSNGKKHECWD